MSPAFIHLPGAPRALRRLGGRVLPVVAVVLAALGLAGPAAYAASPGDLNFAGCIGYVSGCTATNPAIALDSANAVAVAGHTSPAGALHYADGLAVTTDGRHLYTTSGNVVSHFTIGPFGDLTFRGCIGDRPGCTGTYPAGALDVAHGVAVTADGAHLYATSVIGGAVSHFTIAGFAARR